MEEKACKGRICNGKLRPLSDFVKHKKYKDGYTNICKECTNDKYNKSFRNSTERKTDDILNGLEILNEKLDYIITKNLK